MWEAESRTAGGLSLPHLFSAALRKPQIRFTRKSTGLLGWFTAGKTGEKFSEELISVQHVMEKSLLLKTHIQQWSLAAFPIHISGADDAGTKRNSDRRKNTFGRDKLQRIPTSSPKPRGLSSWITVFIHIPGLGSPSLSSPLGTGGSILPGAWELGQQRWP